MYSSSNKEGRWIQIYTVRTTKGDVEFGYVQFEQQKMEANFFASIHVLIQR